MKYHVTKLLYGYNINANWSVKVLTVSLGMHRGYLVTQTRWKNKGRIELAPKI
jgi:hypothetical protein